MNKPTQSDSILAASYVDGELSPSEVTAVEERIRSDAQFAEIVSLLREQSDAFKVLPRFEPAADLADRTLQASVDQVQAIIGHWPVDETQPANEVAAVTTSSSGNWKSIAALAMSLAGLLALTMTLWPDSLGQPAGDGVVASKDADSPDGSSMDQVAQQAPSMAMKKSAAGVDAEHDDQKAMPFGKGAPAGLGQLAMDDDDTNLPKSDASADAHFKSEVDMSDGVEGAIAQRAIPKVQQFSGTPAVAAAKPQQNLLPAVEQIWMVNPDITAEAIGKTLASNEIAIAGTSSASGAGMGGPGGQFAKQAIAPGNSVDAFYIAATPGQMKKALVELSGSADIALFQVPGAPAGGQIADAIEKQFKKETADASAVQQQSLPERIEPPPYGALAQQLVARNLPRSFPAMPVPPILSPEQDAEIARSMKAAPAARSKVPAPQDSASGSGPGVAARADESESAIDLAKSQSASGKPPVSHFDQYFDVADEQLRTYLILVRQTEGMSRAAASPVTGDASEAEVEVP